MRLCPVLVVGLSPPSRTTSHTACATAPSCVAPVNPFRFHTAYLRRPAGRGAPPPLRGRVDMCAHIISGPAGAGCIRTGVVAAFVVLRILPLRDAVRFLRRPAVFVVAVQVPYLP